MLTLYTTPLSANGRKVLAVARHLALEPEVRIVDVYAGEGRAPEYLAINPSGKIPSLAVEDFVLTESNAILQYLAEAHGEFRLWSWAPRVRADIARWMFWEASHWQPALLPVLRDAVAQRLGLVASTPRLAPDWGEAGFRSAATFLDAHLRQRTFLVHDELSIADFAVAGMMTYARSEGFPFAEFEGIAAWYARIEQLDAWRATAVAPWDVTPAARS